MGLFFTIIIVIYLAAVIVRLSNEAHRAGWVNRFFQHFRLRRRGHVFYRQRSMSMTLRLVVPKLLCRLGFHHYSEQMRYLNRLEPGYVLTCERWFCPEFHNAKSQA